MWNLKHNKMSLFTKQIHRHRKQTCLPRWKGINQDCGINTYALLYIKQINNKDLLCSTVNYVQYLVVTYNGKGSEKI